jgi:malonyl-CoA decarboxylase
MSGNFISELLQSITDRGRELLAKARREDDVTAAGLTRLAGDLITRRGEATGVALAEDVLARYGQLSPEARRDFLLQLAHEFGPDRAALDQAIDTYRKEPSELHALRLHEAAEPRRQELIRRLNHAPGGTAALVHMREDLFKHERENPALKALDADFRHLFSSWFNRGFLVLRKIDWTTPANILEKIIRYEAVHEIQNWDDLRRRIEPADRRCFAFFHPRLGDEPLIFVEVALTQDIPEAIAPLLASQRRIIHGAQATTAVFYSISNCQSGLRGISFGNFLIKQVVEELRREWPKLSTFVTLSPVPDFARWLDHELGQPTSILPPDMAQALAPLKGGSQDAPPEALRKPLMTAAALYFTQAKSTSGGPRDSVARFHLGNGARLERLNWHGDLSRKGLAQGHGLMVNYLYELDDIEANHEAFADRGEIITSGDVRQWMKRKGPLRATPEAAAG